MTISSNTAKVTVLTNSRGILTKKIEYIDGRIVKTPPGNVSEGTQRVVDIATITEFAELLTTLQPTQCLTYGISRRPATECPNILSERLWRERGQPRDATPRLGSTFRWHDGPGIFMLDYDPEPGREAASCEELLQMVFAAAPGLAHVPYLWKPSASSCIFRDDECVQDLSGQRIYFLVSNAGDIKRAGEALHQRLWLSGYGYIKLSCDGKMLLRSPVDASVWTPEREDFAAGAFCVDPLKQRLPEPLIANPDAPPGNLTLLLPCLRKDIEADKNEVRRFQALVQAAKQRNAPEAERVREAYIGERAKKLIMECGLNVEHARRIIESLVNERGRLLADFPLVVESTGEVVTVAQVLEDPVKWHNRYFLDPVEPDAGHALANMLSGGRPYLRSYLHGGRDYELLRVRKQFKVRGGDVAELADQCLEVLKADPAMFECGTGKSYHIIQVEGTHLRVYEDAEDIRYYLDSTVAFMRGDKPQDTPFNVAQRIFRMRKVGTFRHLRAIAARPFLRADGSLVDEPGYDARTETLLVMEAQVGDIHANPTLAEAKEALRTLWCPFRLFPFVTDVDRGVWLSALLTAVNRKGLGLAPAHAFRARVPGTGKSELAKATARVGGSYKIETMPPDDEEFKKSTLSILLSGNPPETLIFDNANRDIRSSALASSLTAENFSGRVLGKSTNAEVPNKMALMFTGNNVKFIGEMCRRVLVCDLHVEGMERPETREFDFVPEAMVKNDHEALHAAAITLMQAALAAPKPSTQGCMDFIEWNDLVRRTVCWARDHLTDQEDATLPSLEDPVRAVDREQTVDSERESLRSVLSAVHEWRGEDGFALRELLNIAVGPDGITPQFRDEARVAAVTALEDALVDEGKQKKDLQSWAAGYFKRSQGRPVSGLELRKAGQDAHSKGTQWKVLKRPTRARKAVRVVWAAPRVWPSYRGRKRIANPNRLRGGQAWY